MNSAATHRYIKWFTDITIDDVPLDGGKNASLGEMVRELASKGVKVPDGVAIATEAFRHLIREAGIDMPSDTRLALTDDELLELARWSAAAAPPA